MSGQWRDSTRSQRLPKDWPRIRRRILKRDPICRDPSGCSQPSTEVDHRVNNDDHSDSNLQGLCTPHHKAKTQREAQAAKPSRLRPVESHPGLKR